MTRQGGLLVADRPVETLKRAETPRLAIPHPGLCTNCDHADTCALPRAEGVPVIHCEEWTCSTATPDVRREAVEEREPERAAMEETAERPKGLCATCEGFATCAFWKPPEGVWHCEEYY